MRSIKDIFRSYAEFDANGRHTNGTDKESNHAYGDAYEAIFKRWFVTGRYSIELMMEVGVAGGASMLAWREVFPNALVVGMDIHACEKGHGERLEFHLGDQRLQADCERAANNRRFDVIVEDAYHSIDHTLLTLFWLWPFVRPGGLYIVEEWANIGGCRKNIAALFPNAEIVDTTGPFGGIEPLVVLRKK